MYSDEEYAEEEQEEMPSGNKFQEFYNNNKKLIWIAGIIIILVIVLSLFSKGGGSSSKGVVIYSNREAITEKNVQKLQSLSLTATLNGNSNAVLEWNSSNPEVATVSNGYVTTIASGTTTITAKDPSSGMAATCIINVIEGNPNVVLQDIKFPEGDFIISVGNKASLEMVSSPSDGYVQSKSFTSSAPDIAKVDNNGTLEGIKVGSARIMVNVNNKFNRDTMVRVVSKNIPARFVTSVTNISFTNTSDKIGVGQTKKLDFKVTPNNADEITILWESANENIAKVDEEGNITGVAVGKTTIKARTLDMKDLGSINIEVAEDFTINVVPTSVSVSIGNTQYVQINLNPSTASRNGLTFEVSDKTIATVATNDGGKTIQIGGLKTGNTVVIIKSNGVEKVRIPVTVGSSGGSIGGGGGGYSGGGDSHDNKGYKISSKDADGNGFINRNYSSIVGNCGKGPLKITFSNFDSSIDKVKVCKYKYNTTKCNPDNGTTITDGGTYTISEKGEWVLLVNEYKGTTKKRSTLDWYACLDSGTSSSSSTQTGEACYCNPINSRCTYATTAPAGYEKQSQITTRDGCAIYSNNNSEGCFRYNGQYVWGNYGNIKGYINVSLNTADTKNKCLGLNNGTNPNPTTTPFKITSGGKSIQTAIGIGKYLAVTANANTNFSGVRFCYTLSSLGKTCNLNKSAASVSVGSGAGYFRPSSSNQTYYKEFTATSSKTLWFDLDHLDNWNDNGPDGNDVIVEIAGYYYDNSNNKVFSNTLKFTIKNNNSKDYKTWTVS